jgi:hypothetical protein
MARPEIVRFGGGESIDSRGGSAPIPFDGTPFDDGGWGDDAVVDEPTQAYRPSFDQARRVDSALRNLEPAAVDRSDDQHVGYSPDGEPVIRRRGRATSSDAERYFGEPATSRRPPYDEFGDSSDRQMVRPRVQGSGSSAGRRMITDSGEQVIRRRRDGSDGDRSPVVYTGKSHKARNLFMAAAVLTGGVVAVKELHPVGWLEHQVTHIATKAAKAAVHDATHALSGGAHAIAHEVENTWNSLDGNNSRPPSALAAPLQESIQVTLPADIGGGKVTELVNSTAKSIHRDGGSTFSQQLMAETLVGNSLNGLVTPAEETITGGVITGGQMVDGKLVGGTRVGGKVTAVTIKMPQLQLLEPNINPLNIYNEANVPAYATPDQAAADIATYKQDLLEHKKTPSNVKVHDSAWCAFANCSFTHAADLTVAPLGTATGLLAFELDTYSPDNPKIKTAEAATIGIVKTYEQGEFPGASITVEWPSELTPLQQIENNFQNAVIKQQTSFDTENFEINKTGDLEFDATYANGVDSSVDLGPSTPAAAAQLEQRIPVAERVVKK